MFLTFFFFPLSCRTWSLARFCLLRAGGALSFNEFELKTGQWKHHHIAILIIQYHGLKVIICMDKI